MAPSKTIEQINESMEQLRRMLRIVSIVEDSQPIGIIKLSEILGMPRHKVRYLLRLLEHDGVIKPSNSGCTLEPGYGEYVEDQLACLEALKGTISDIQDEMSKS